MQANNSMSNRNPSFSAVINSDGYRNMINKALGDPRRAASFVSTLISTVSANSRLKACEPGSVIAAALRGEGMGLSIALGQYSIVPYGNQANYQLSYKGLSQLAIRSGQYLDLGAFEVREGEYKGVDKRTRRPQIEWIADEDERNAKPIVGYYAFYELKSGFFKSIYWTHDKILQHADRYSKAFSLEKYNKMLSGKMSESEVSKLRFGSPWYGAPDDAGHMKMCCKTMLIQLLNDGVAPVSIEMLTAINNETEQEKSGEAVIYADDPMVIDVPGEVVDTESGEVISKE